MTRKVGIGSSKFLRTVGRCVGYYPLIAMALGSVKTGIFICQLLYWQERGEKGEWIYKSRKQMEEETGLSREEQDTAKRLLKRLKIIETKRAGIPATTHYKIDFDRFDEVIDNYVIEREIKRKEEAKKKAEKEEAKDKMIFGKKK